MAPLLMHVVDGMKWNTESEALITASSHGFLRVWDTETADSICSIPEASATTALCTMKVLGRLFAFVGSWDSRGILQVDLERKQVVKVIHQRQPGTWVTSISMMDDKRTLVVANSLGPVRIWDAPSGTDVASLEHPNEVSVAQVSLLRVFLTTASPCHSCSRVTFNVIYLQVVLHGQHIFTAASDGVVRKWRRDAEQQVFEQTLEIQVQCKAKSAAAITVTKVTLTSVKGLGTPTQVSTCDVKIAFTP